VKAPPVIAAARPELPDWRRFHWPIWLGLVGLAVALFVLWKFEPRGQFFYPQCWMYRMTGFQCPGCGGLRATHALLNGDIAAAWKLNPLVVGLAPVAGWFAMIAALRWWRGITLPNPFGHRYAIAVFIGLLVGFGIGRNLNF
jgi:hypothetical protein